MKKSLLPLALSLGATLFLSGTSHATLVAGWNFNTLSIATAAPPGTGSVPTSISASSGTGTVELTTYAGNIDDFAGTAAVNQIGTDVAGPSLSVIGGPAGTGGAFPGNGGSITISLALNGFQDPIVTFATQRTGTGYNSNQFAYSIDGGINFTNFGDAYTPASAFALQTFDLTTVDSLDNLANVVFKITFNGDTSAAGNNRIDNLQVNATEVVPEPTAAALGLIGLACILRRRRA